MGDRMRRRDFITFVGGAVALPAGARAQQQTGKVHRIGYLGFGTATAAPGLLDAFQHGLRELGWVEGQNIVTEYRYAEGQYDRLSGLANELVRLKVDVIAASPTPAAVAAKNATETIPIIGISFDNPVQNRLVESLARPGGNVTGLSYSVGPEIFGKDLELLRELIPEVRHVGADRGGDAGVLHLDRDLAPVVQRRAVDLPDRGGGDRLRVEAGEVLLQRPLEL